MGLDSEMSGRIGGVDVKGTKVLWSMTTDPATGIVLVMKAFGVVFLGLREAWLPGGL